MVNNKKIIGNYKLYKFKYLNYLKNIPIPGEKLSYNDFVLKFIVDESLENYLLVHNWMRGFGFPEKEIIVS